MFLSQPNRSTRMLLLIVAQVILACSRNSVEFGGRRAGMCYVHLGFAVICTVHGWSIFSRNEK
jgi:hypothetical protein